MTDERYHLRAVCLPDGTGPRDVWIEDGRFTFTPLQDALTLPGRYMAPGMVDAHVHLSIDFAGLGKPHGDPTLVLDNARRHLGAGVLALRDAGYVQQLELDGVELPPLPVIQRSGWIVVPEGRFFPGVEVGKHTASHELTGRVHEVADAGLPWFKVIADFPDAEHDLFSAPLNYPLEVLEAAFSAAHARGIRVMAHTTGPSIDDLVRLGADAIEHGMSATPASVRLMAEHGVHWTPTLATVEAHLGMAEGGGASPTHLRAWSERMTAALREAMSLDVPILVGTDEMPHGQIVAEMDALARHGMTPSEVIAAATTIGRRVLGLRGIEEGAPADLVAWDEDPRTDLAKVAHPRTILAGGRRVEPSAARGG